MGLRLRLKASFDLSPYTGQSLVILEALKKYGMIVADNGSSWFITGAADPRWDDDDLNQLEDRAGPRVRSRRHRDRSITVTVSSHGPLMAKTDANPPMPEFSTSYVLQEVDPNWLTPR